MRIPVIYSLFYTGPVNVGRNNPTMVVTIHMRTATSRDLIQPIL